MFTVRTLLLTIGILISTACAKKEPSPPQSTVQGSTASLVSELSSVTVRAEKAPNFAWKDASGKVVDFDSFRGKATLVNFWATWCVPCKRELPDLVALSKEFSGKEVKILGISTDRGSNVVDEVSTFVREQGIPYQNLISNEEIEEAFGNIRMIPTSFLIDSQGKIVQTFVGGRSKEFFAQAITAVLK
jgi:thiol-disulfide isomerase/thioredoxin